MDRVRLHLGEYEEEDGNNAYELAIVDPPYGIGIDKAMNANKGRSGFKIYRKTNWDSSIPKIGVFSTTQEDKNQIIWEQII